MSTNIPVTVVTGPLGSGKTTLLNRLLRVGASAPNPADIVVLECEAGTVPFDHGRVVSVKGDAALVTSACPCCAVQGDVVDALRDLFLQALHRKIPPLSQVLIETAGTADPAAALYTLKYDRFLGERFAYRGCIAVLDGQEGSEPLHEIQVQQQAALADLVIVSKTDVATSQQVDDLRAAVQAVNPGAVCLAATEVGDLAELLEAGTFRMGTRIGVSGRGLWSGRKMAPQAAPALRDMTVATLAWQAPLRRSDFARIADRLQSVSGLVMVRVRGRVWFRGASGASLVNGVHQQLHVMDASELADDSCVVAGQPVKPSSGPDEGRSVLMLVYRGAPEAGFLDELLALAPGGEFVVSSGRNSAHTSIALRAM
ncbi:MAG TPA: GTP-binding protein [Burkholderiaceae bacterium]|nr:GTP-binding protein [Burkholderiaceae bacterium]